MASSNAHQVNGHHEPRQHLKVIIVGAGIAGLALAGLLGHSGHHVVVVEGAPKIAEVGAGINCSPNQTRLLSRWGLDGRIRKHTDAMTNINLRRWEDGQILGVSPLMPQVEKRHGAPQYMIHRAELHGALLEDAQTVAEIHVNSMVVSVDFQKPSITLHDGRVLEADLIIGADGMKSTCRRLMYEKLGLVDKATPTGDAAFRACLPVEKVTDPELRAFVTQLVATRWLGDGRHVQGYPIRHANLYNLVMCHPDPGFTEESWTTKASKQDLLDQFGSWDPHRLRKLVDLIPEENVLIWHLCVHDPLPTWVMGKVVLLGDACHPMLPYVGQGGAQAIEDVAVLHLAINRITATDGLSVALKAYELARKPRAEHIMSIADVNRGVLHLPDGPEQQERDRKFGLVAEGGENPDLLGHAEMQRYLWDHDPEKEFLDNAEGTPAPF
ncbi:uncharacterized protein Z520_02401 [Fonsecaea multimorphosa CBS 102226]|uniref:FAD-binding domain-containing protein n=1 Tax=Fonsecaea multimorphosa CBS 102226 TaxID=1442371 RepID=A0A0D2K857_9EURO|nr:uncharacterized protein Z520_02401 [Fonsecaea multimorphosa CBS 102226]KIY02263.1 hypothetical protein Z520_02401 [Fonsecaea multimorphosa CBS 102226]OAL28911.1 hypothetical protein AYO22_02347 [Fonsecaea multimorphosa]